MEPCEKLVEKHLALEQHQLNMDLFRQAEKEYLDFISSEESDSIQHPNEEVPNRKLCFEGRKHQFRPNKKNTWLASHSHKFSEACGHFFFF
jgi:hypothetical protein